jgi:hypothetical protein
MAMIGMDYVAQMAEFGGIFILLFCFGLSQTGKQYDTLPMGSVLINYIRRDGYIVPLVGKRVFSGESFLDIPALGLIEDLGKDTVFTWGRKRIRFGLENINYTPDPRYGNLCQKLYDLGFDDSDDYQNIMDIPNIDSNRDRAIKVYYLERMGNIYWNMIHQGHHGGKKLMDVLRKKQGKKIVFGKSRFKDKPEFNQKDYMDIDKVIGERK